MSTMRDLAVELELYWTWATVGDYISRRLPNGDLAVISSWQCGEEGGYELVVNRVEVGRFDHRESAMVAAGVLARRQLAAMAEEWTV